MVVLKCLLFSSPSLVIRISEMLDAHAGEGSNGTNRNPQSCYQEGCLRCSGEERKGIQVHFLETDTINIPVDHGRIWTVKLGSGVCQERQRR